MIDELSACFFCFDSELYTILAVFSDLIHVFVALFSLMLGVSSHFPLQEAHLHKLEA